MTSNDKDPKQVWMCVNENKAALEELIRQLDQYKETLSKFPTAVFWLSFLEMSDILLRFLYYER